MVGCTGSFNVSPLPAIVPTFTPTPIPCRAWTFEDNTADGWSVPYWNPICSSATVTSLSLLGAPGSLGNFGLDIILPPAGCGSGTNDVQAQVSTGSCPAFPIDFQSLGITGVRCQLWANTDLFSVSSSESIVACPYLVTGGGRFGGCYNGWPAQTPQQIPSPGGQWMAVTLIPGGGTWSTDQTNVTAVGIEVNEASVNQPPLADVVVDNVQLY